MIPNKGQDFYFGNQHINYQALVMFDEYSEFNL